LNWQLANHSMMGEVNMKILVFGGSGKIGSAVAWDLAKRNEVSVIGLVGRNENSLNTVRDRIGSSKIRIHILDILDHNATEDLMAQYDVGVCTLPDRKTSYTLLESAISAGLNLVDVLEEYHRRPDADETEGLVVPADLSLNEYGDQLHQRALEKGVTFLDGIGFAPGISNIMVGEAIRQLDQAETAVARVGGIPSKTSAQRHPLKYMITWAFEHVLREYMVKLLVLKGGKVVPVDAGTELESFQFDKFDINETLECAITPGMPSMIYTRSDLKEFAEKTVRWPGHWQGIQTLKETGMLDLDPVQVGDTKISPREVLLSVITPKLLPQDGDTDVCVMWNTVTGRKDGKTFRIDSYLWDEADTVNKISSMERVTGFAAAIGAVLIGRGEITAKGLVPPEDCIFGQAYESFRKEIEKHNIHIMETVQEIPG
jgi:lysine 6-dehydrogenase